MRGEGKGRRERWMLRLGRTRVRERKDGLQSRSGKNAFGARCDRSEAVVRGKEKREGGDKRVAGRRKKAEGSSCL